MLQLATKADRVAVNDIACQIQALHVAWRSDIFCETQALYPQERFDDCVSRRQLYVAKIEGNVVGYALLAIRDSNHNGMHPCRIMEIQEFGVHEAIRGYGIGTQMMEDVHALAKAFRCTHQRLNVYPANEDAIRFYEANGFMIQNIAMQQKL